jgi:hypothetical protein
MKKLKIKYLIISIILLIVELLIAIFVNDNFIRPIFGDYLAAILLFCILATFLKLSKSKIAILALLISYFIEGLQFIHILQLLNLEQYTLLKIIFGTSFSWTDMFAYTMGILTILLIHNFNTIKS